MNRALVGFLIAMFMLASAHADGNNPELTATLPEAMVTVKFPASKFSVGDQKPFAVTVTPAAGKAAPTTVRGRFGMPYHGHWATDEQSQPYVQGELPFMSNFMMNGVYRFRIWLDYADGHKAKTAIDFKVMVDEDLDPEVATE